MSDSRPTMHLIGHAHIDPVWLWQWPEGYQEIKATFRSALDRISEDDEFVFTSSSAAFYEWVRRNDRPLFDEIAARVEEGRWHITGGWWVEPDCNLPSGEAFVRQALVGQRWFAEHLGRTATVGFNPDSFGHHAMLPQLLLKSGLRSYVFMRPSDHELGLAARTFWWESDDGSRVLAYRIPYEYLTWSGEIDAHVVRCAAELKAPHEHLMCFYGVGNHGGGPTQENLASIRRLRERDDLPRLEMSDPASYFAAVRGSGVDLPVVHAELQNHARGCYSAHSGIKMWNRRAERSLLDAERLGTVAARLTDHRAVEDLGRAWKNVLFNQFHDILPGTAIEPAYEDARDELGEATAIAGRAIQDALQAISWRVDVPELDGSVPVVVWNPHAWEHTAPVELEIGRKPDDPVVIDDEGRCHPVQSVQSLATVKGGRSRITFQATLPPMGYQTFRIAAGADHPIEVDDVDGTDLRLDNGLLRVEFEHDRGLSRLYDITHDVDLLKEGGTRVDVLKDTSDTWSHGVTRYDDVVGSFAVQRVLLVERGPVRSTVRVESTYGRSRLIEDVMLYRATPAVDVRVTLDWQEQFELVKLRLPVALHVRRATYEIPFGAIERPTEGQEVPGQRWVDVSGVVRGRGQVYGLSLINDAKQAFDAHGDELSLTVLRSPIHAHHDPRIPSDEERYSFQDQGIQRFSYRLLPHVGGWADAGTVREAWAFDQPPTPIIESSHAGPLPRSTSFLSVDVDNVVVSALKEAEDGGAIIVRCYETAGRATEAVLDLPIIERQIAATLAPHEVRTFRVPDDPEAPIVEVNLLEWED